jgi:deazaflavin-dependent oxidoreductase (nitroreductase family)
VDVSRVTGSSKRVTLKRVDPRRKPSAFAHAFAALATTRIARFISRHINWKLDPWLLRVTHGRVATTLVFPTAVLETTGAKTGASRRNAIIYFHDGERIIIVASNAGSRRHPSWYHNLRAHPDVLFDRSPMRATIIDADVERNRLWEFADNVFPAYRAYRADAAKVGRVIPIVALMPR